MVVVAMVVVLVHSWIGLVVLVTRATSSSTKKGGLPLGGRDDGVRGRRRGEGAGGR
jgi:hypothetical protein